MIEKKSTGNNIYGKLYNPIGVKMAKFIMSMLIILIGAWAGSVDDRVKEGVALRESGNYDQAILKLQEALKSKPKHPEANYELGQTYMKKADYENALKYLKDAFDYGYDEVKARLALGLAYRAAEHCSDAVNEFQILVQLQPNNAEYCYYYADASLRCGTSGLAEGLFRQALKLDPAYIPAMLGLGDFFRNKRIYDSAQTYYEKAKAAKPDYAPTYLVLSTFYAERKDSVKSLAAVQKYIQLQPRDYKGYNALAEIQSKKKNWEGAILNTAKAVSLETQRLEPCDSWAFFTSRPSVFLNTRMC